MTEDAELMRIAFLHARNSPDPSTQNGAIIVDRGGLWMGIGSNTFPAGVKPLQERLERPDKYLYIEHAERAAIYDAARDGLCTHRGVMYALWAACADCARGIIESGITELVTHSFYNRQGGKRWGHSIEHGELMLEEAGVIVRTIDDQIMNFNESIRFNGEKVNF
jgi:dCMP deaminase